MSGHRGYVRYSDSVETRGADEEEVIGKIIQSMTQESQTVAARDGRTVRASHAKSTGLLKGELRVLDSLPEPLRQGLFAAARSYPIVVRLAQGPGEVLSDSVSTHRGMAIKGLEKSTGLPEAVKQAVSATSRATNAVVNALGGDSPTFGFFGHTKRSPLADAYFSQAALRHGDYIAKIGVFPVSPDLVAAIDSMLDTGADPNAFRTAVVDHFRTKGAEFEMRVQLCTSRDSMPVEDASVAWPEDESPYVAVARLVLPPQNAYSPARQAYFDEVLSFQPAHALAAHRPLGSLMRARLQTYQALSLYRHQQNNRSQVEPGAIEQIPD